MSTHAPTAAVTRPMLRSRVRMTTAPFALAVMVTVAFVVRTVASVGHSVPRLFPDEYIYAALSRSLAHGSFTIRGEPAAFPAFLEPLLAAPLWRLAGDDIELGYKLVQSLHALAGSLAAVGVYALARRARLTPGLSLAAAAVTLALPAMIYVNFITADALAWPLALAALAAAAAALERPNLRRQALFLLLAGLATLARVQYVILPLAFLFGAVAVSSWSPRRLARDFRATLVLLAAGLALVVLSGPTRVLGYYDAIFDLDVDPVAIGRWAATDLYLLAFAVGIALVPGAVLALGALARPRSRGELAVVSVVVATCVLLLGEAALYAANGSVRFQERYLLTVLALVPVLFVVGTTRERSRKGRVSLTAVSVGLAMAFSLAPLSGFTALTGKMDSPTLWAVAELEHLLGVGGASLAVAGAATLLVAAGVVASWRPGRGSVLVLGLTALTLSVMAAAAASFDARLSARVARTTLGPDPAWILRSGVGSVDVLQTPYSSRVQISDHLFWNPNIERILRMRDASEVDVYGSVSTHVAADGRIVAGGEIVRGPLLVQEYASTVDVEGAELVGRHVSHSLWRPSENETPRLAMLFAGRYLDGFMGSFARITVWPAGTEPRRATLVVRFRLPEDVTATTLDVRGPGISRRLRLTPGRWSTLSVPVAAVRRPVTLHLRTRMPFLTTDGRLLAAETTRPRLIDR